MAQRIGIVELRRIGLCCAAAVLTACSGESAETEAPPEQAAAAVRVRNNVADAPTIDFCVRGQQNWLGPVMQVLLDARDGLPSTEVTGYLPLAPGAYIARLVDPATAYCIPSLTGVDFEMSVAEGQKYTAEVVGYLQPMTGEEAVSLVVTRDE